MPMFPTNWSDDGWSYDGNYWVDENTGLIYEADEVWVDPEDNETWIIGTEVWVDPDDGEYHAVEDTWVDPEDGETHSTDDVWVDPDDGEYHAVEDTWVDPEDGETHALDDVYVTYDGDYHPEDELWSDDDGGMFWMWGATYEDPDKPYHGQDELFSVYYYDDAMFFTANDTGHEYYYTNGTLWDEPDRNDDDDEFCDPLGNCKNRYKRSEDAHDEPWVEFDFEEWDDEEYGGAFGTASAVALVLAAIAFMLGCAMTARLLFKRHQRLQKLQLRLASASTEPAGADADEKLVLEKALQLSVEQKISLTAATKQLLQQQGRALEAPNQNTLAVPHPPPTAPPPVLLPGAVSAALATDATGRTIAEAERISLLKAYLASGGGEAAPAQQQPAGADGAAHGGGLPPTLTLALTQEFGVQRPGAPPPTPAELLQFGAVLVAEGEARAVALQEKASAADATAMSDFDAPSSLDVPRTPPPAMPAAPVLPMMPMGGGGGGGFETVQDAGHSDATVEQLDVRGGDQPAALSESYSMQLSETTADAGQDERQKRILESAAALEQTKAFKHAAKVGELAALPLDDLVTRSLDETEARMRRANRLVLGLALKAPTVVVKVKIPPGGKPGKKMQVEGPDGTQHTVVIPKGKKAGDVWEAAVPVPRPTAKVVPA